MTFVLLMTMTIAVIAAVVLSAPPFVVAQVRKEATRPRTVEGVQAGLKSLVIAVSIEHVRAVWIRTIALVGVLIGARRLLQRRPTLSSVLFGASAIVVAVTSYALLQFPLRHPRSAVGLLSVVALAVGWILNHNKEPVPRILHIAAVAQVPVTACFIARLCLLALLDRDPGAFTLAGLAWTPLLETALGRLQVSVLWWTVIATIGLATMTYRSRAWVMVLGQALAVAMMLTTPLL